MRPNFFVNTPDILHAYLQYGGPAAFKIRARCWRPPGRRAGACTPATSCSSTSRCGRAARSTSTRRSTRSGSATGTPPRREGRTLAPYLTRLNAVRRAHPALQQLRNLVIHSSDDENVLVFSKQRRGDDTGHRRDQPRPARAPARPWSTSTCPRSACDWHDSLAVHDEITGQDWHWGQHNYVRLDPGARARPPADRAEDRMIELDVGRSTPVPTGRTRAASSGRPRSRQQPDWFKTAVFYEVLVRSFRDSNADGTGDFRGLIEKLDYLAVARRRLPVGAAVLHLAAARRRLRRRRLHLDPPRVRHGRRLPRLRRRPRTSAASA